MIYFDNAASTKVSRDVLDSFNKAVEMYYANPSSVHELGRKAHEIENLARNQIANLFSVKPSEVIFTSGATESNNLALKGICASYKNRGNHIISATNEHPSIINTLKQLEKEQGFKVTFLNPNKDGVITEQQVEEVINDDTILVSIMTVNNETGHINQIEKIAKMLKKYPRIFFHTDATQAIGKIKIDYSNVDLISLSAHKLHGFKGSGLLLKKEIITLSPILSGGGQEFNFRSGTNNLPIEIALAKTLRIAFENSDKHYQKVKLLNQTLKEELIRFKNIKIVSSPEGSPYILNFITNKKASVVAEYLSNKGIYVSTKSACSSKKNSVSHVLNALGYNDKEASNGIRVSFTSENEVEEIKVFTKTLEEALNSIK